MKSCLALIVLLLLTGCGSDPPAGPPKYPYIEGTITEFYTSQVIGGNSCSTIVFTDGRAVTFYGVSPSSVTKNIPVKVYYNNQTIIKIIDEKKEDLPISKESLPQ
jgi:hypothetical protein